MIRLPFGSQPWIAGSGQKNAFIRTGYEQRNLLEISISQLTKSHE